MIDGSRVRDKTEAPATHKIGTFICVRPSYSFHVVRLGDGDAVKDIEPLADSDIWINAGYFVFRNKVFDYINEGEELVVEPFERMIAEGELIAYRHDGFFRAMDTLRDKQLLEDMVQRGHMPWQPKLATLAPAEAAE